MLSNFLLINNNANAFTIFLAHIAWLSITEYDFIDIDL